MGTGRHYRLVSNGLENNGKQGKPAKDNGREAQIGFGKIQSFLPSFTSKTHGEVTTCPILH